MIKKEKIYIDTSVISAYYDLKQKQRQEDTVKFWTMILPNYEPYVSEITIDELNSTKDSNLREKFNALIKDYQILNIDQNIEKLANEYIIKEIFPKKYLDDARHVACASYYDITYLISWNFGHLVKVKTRKLVNYVNTLLGLKELEIISPLEL